ncbi:succinylglutamate desuccinylase [Marinomonas pollencensis]|uniref:Succinylglutamate desuccinylase n=2 Tax=Marinomonas pollencensis TaxID=491954 RepID=A0A3E0DJM1_9GAMM|nr:succinylglutamate desuccinylase [Marinomonas pollencensis]
MIPNNDFLALTLNNPETLAPFQLEFNGGQGFVEETGILRLEPQQATDINLVLSVGIHGNETGPIELVNQLLKAILEGRFALTVRLLVIIGNPIAANRAERFCDVNLNRLFSGAWRHYEGLEVPRAQSLEQAVTRFFAGSATGSVRLHYDLHTAIRGSEYEKFVVHPFIGDAPYDLQQLGLLAASGIDAVLLSQQPTTTFSYYSSAEHGAHAFTVELGKVYPFGENDLSRFEAIRQTLITLISDASFPKLERDAIDSKLKFFAVQDALVKDHEDYQLTISEDVKNFTGFEKGYELAHSSQSQYLIKASGDAIIFPNANVPIGQRAGLVVRPMRLADLALR